MSVPDTKNILGDEKRNADLNHVYFRWKRNIEIIRLIMTLHTTLVCMVIMEGGQQTPKNELAREEVTRYTLYAHYTR